MPAAILRVSLPTGTVVGPDSDPWLSEGWLLNSEGTTQTFTVRIEDTSASIRSYDTRLVIALNDAGYNNLVSLLVNSVGVPKNAFRYGTPTPYGIWTWPSGDVYPTCFNDTLVNVGTIQRKGFVEVTVSVTFSSVTGVRMHFDAWGKKVAGSPKSDGDITHNSPSSDSTVLFEPGTPQPQPPYASFYYAPSFPNVGEIVTFNASSSYDPDGNIVSYTWNFGDGTPIVVENDPITTHSYAALGDYEVTLTVTDNDDLDGSIADVIHVCLPPVASFVFSPPDPLEHETVTFDASSSTPDGGTIISYEWNFGDGNITTVSNPIITHAYAIYGTYTITLKVTDSEGKWDTESKPITVERLPIADFTWSPLNPEVYEIVTFDASYSTPDGGIIISYEWNFGDGTPNVIETDPVTTHHYTTPGNHTITLNVTDSEDRWDTESKVITVNPSPSPEAILHISLPDGKYEYSNPDPWLDECWLLNITDLSGTFTLKIEDVSGSITSYDTHLVIALNDAGYNNLVSLTVNVTTVPKTAFKKGTPTPYGIWTWPSGDVYPTWFNDTLVNIGTILPKRHVNVTVSVTFSDVTGVRMHFDAYGSKVDPPPPSVPGQITRNPLSADSTVLFWPKPVVKYLLTVRTDPPGLSPQPTRDPVGEPGPTPDSWWYDNCTYVTLTATPIISVSSDTRYRFSYWDVDGTSVPGNLTSTTVHMNANHTATAHYIIQYLVTFNQTGLSSDATGTVVTVNGDQKNFTSLPFSQWSDNCSWVTYIYSSNVGSSVSGKRFSLVSITGPASPIHISSPVTVIGNYKAQYQITVTASPNGALGGTFKVTYTQCGITYTTVEKTTEWTEWVDKDSTVTVSDPQQFVPSEAGVGGVRYRFDSYSPSATVTMTEPKTITLVYKTQYRLTMATNYGTTNPAVGQHWYNAGSVVPIQAFAPSLVYPGQEQYVWNGWTGTGTISYTGMDNPATVTMNSPITQTASWTRQFLLTIKTSGLPSAYPTRVYLGGLQVGTASDASPYTKWFDFGASTGTIGVDNTVSGATGTQYVFRKWVEDSSTNNPRASETMNTPKTFTAEYKTQYYLTVTSPYDTPTPTSGWFDSGTPITESVTSPWPGPIDTRYVCTGWIGTGSVPPSGTTTSVTFTINVPSSITWTWKPQYLLTVRTDPTGLSPQPTRNVTGEAGPSGSWWYYSSTNVLLTAQSVTGYTFLNWNVDGANVTGNPIAVHMNMPHTATALYQVPPPPKAVGGEMILFKTDKSSSIQAPVELMALLLAAAIAVASVILIRRKKGRQ